MNSAAPCSVCKEGGHEARKCPTLTQPLSPGFQGGGGGGGHAHDDEDESLRTHSSILTLNVQKVHTSPSYRKYSSLHHLPFLNAVLPLSASA